MQLINRSKYRHTIGQAMFFDEPKIRQKRFPHGDGLVDSPAKEGMKMCFRGRIRMDK